MTLQIERWRCAEGTDSIAARTHGRNPPDPDPNQDQYEQEAAAAAQLLGGGMALYHDPSLQGLVRW